MKFIYKTAFFIALPLSIMLLASSCKKDTIVPIENATEQPAYTVPTTGVATFEWTKKLNV